MNVPGWTAETALSKPSKTYWSGTTEAMWAICNHGLAAGIVPAQTDAGYGEGYETEENETQDYSEDYGEEHDDTYEEEPDESHSEASHVEEGEATEA